MPNEDKRAAAAVLTNLSGFIISASLAMLAIEGALFAFVLGNRDFSFWYILASVLAFIFFVTSIVCGGWGTTQTAEELAGSTWNASVANGWFSAQAGFAFAGLILFIGSALLSGSPKETEIERLLSEQAVKINTLDTAIEAITTSYCDLREVPQSLEKLDHTMTQRIEGIEKLIDAQNKKPPIGEHQRIHVRGNLATPKVAMSRKDVYIIQAQLLRLGFLSENQMTGVYDEDTETAVKRYQSSRLLRVDGIAGPVTRRRLNSE